MIAVSKAFYDALQRGEMPEINCILSSQDSRWIFGKIQPRLGADYSALWDGTRLYGQGTYGYDLGLVSADAKVLAFGSVSSSIAYSNKDVMMSLTYVQIGSMRVTLDNGSGFFSDLLGGDKAVSFLNFDMSLTCGFPSLDPSDTIELFAGTITEEALSNTACKIIAQSNTPTLMETFILPRSSRYTNPQSGNDILPYVYGNTAENSDIGVSTCPCIDTVNFVHCLAAHALPNTAAITLYADGVEVTTGYTVTKSGDYEGQGVIAYVTFDAAQTGDITMTTTLGKDSLTNPIDIIEDMLSEVGDTTSRQTNSWTQAHKDADTLAYLAAGVLAADQPPAYWLTEIMTSFLGSWYLNARQELVVSFDSTQLSTGDVAGILRERDASKITGQRTRANICNQLAINYAYSLADVDKRFKQNANPQYLAFDDGLTTLDSASQAKYGELQKTLALNWCRHDANITTLQQRVISRYASPVWTVTFPEQTLRNLVVEPGDFVAASAEIIEDSNGLPTKNQIYRVLSVDRDLDALTITFTLMDFGVWLTTEPYLWDGSHTYGEPNETYGDNRDRSDY